MKASTCWLHSSDNTKQGGSSPQEPRLRVLSLLPSTTGPDVGKMQKRKHQIGSLFQQAKLQELEMLEKV